MRLNICSLFNNWFFSFRCSFTFLVFSTFAKYEVHIISLLNR
ncbi:unnamed protein product [Schistosoma mattheei]|uniref:Uncharacterized protein n=1 Tax=Schistosoma mattheei TaxID=31246 RepID=A0A3P8JLH7_9TREM|nr:unnamed protein product [Schistosoma mattheei]